MIGGPVGGLIVGNVVTVEYQNQYWCDDIGRFRPDEHKIVAGVVLEF